MGTMKEMAAEYRAAAARMAMRIQEHEERGDVEPSELNRMREVLQEVREVGRVLECYYDTPRPRGPYTLTGMAARGASRDDH